MIKDYIVKLSRLVVVAGLCITQTACRETFEQLFSDDIAVGDEVAFTTSLQSRAITRASEVPLTDRYKFTIGMYTKDDANKETKVAEGEYEVDTKDTGSLKATKSLYWPSTTVAYGFKSIAGNEQIDADQTSHDKWLQQDRLVGGAPDYRTAKQWKSYNIGQGLDSEENWKKIPLSMQHQYSRITVILKAGEGVSREALAYGDKKNNLSATVYSYHTSLSEPLKINPLASAATVDYDDATGVSTTQFDAIVYPYDYSEKPLADLITQIRLSNQTFSFYAGNDTDTNQSSYKLGQGQHLTITITLGRESRQTLMTAYIEDWDEEVNNLICDDLGNNGDPISIYDCNDLKKYLADHTYNKAGNVFLVENDMILSEWGDYSLNCTLNLCGHKLTGSGRFLNTINSTASLVNGTIEMTGSVDAAIAISNAGNIEDVKIIASNGAKASKAGAVFANTGVISKCRSEIEVSGGTSDNYVGGIAATSLGEKAIINACTVTNRVDGNKSGAKVGGIVGQASGNVSNNTFEYGITLSQAQSTDITYNNVVGEVKDELSTNNNTWPNYTGIIDCQDDFKYTDDNGTYRLARDISINSTVGNVAYQLEGNGKTINTTAMIFKTITGSVSNLTVNVTADLIASNITDDKDIMAPLAETVSGSNAEINNVTVKIADGKYIQASNPAGLVFSAKGGATIRNCQVTAQIKAFVGNPTSGERKYAGGIVAAVSNATITQCIFHSGSSLTTDVGGATVIYYGGIVGGYVSNSETAAITITDCNNFANLANDDYHGGILGYAMNDSGENTTKDCQGNWWPDKTKGVAKCATGTSETAVIGKRNSQEPTEKKD